MSDMVVREDVKLFLVLAVLYSRMSFCFVELSHSVEISRTCRILSYCRALVSVSVRKDLKLFFPASPFLVAEASRPVESLVSVSCVV
jgi:hypothetical protein